ncbi:cupin domain-containing protein [Dickeya dianthicola]|uniref:Cupin domain-containing protein n=2 Tax=Dickeya dianthicola TaxID=204039 RepID=A0AAP2D162_9GAMM|nr:cupin domain-containing protein [Dickeya dianthicola]ATO33338.1 Cupin 2, conserved barrel [Dickeya dianthicola RNS04.9]MBI0440265.1 cupin domain-containing protein [Dickeya dianthicola]MBI0451314.1 cupin domain-containing protein [Dickeya dianthicola]MBI0455709.1 cupin domain-containing protein [Dickeya dianthicola]MBI0460048.1 cupin domain-containing protein [Dickeya dianthicola]
MMTNQLKIVRPDHATDTSQKLPYFVGISRDTVGAKHISMNMVVIPAGAQAEPHYHVDYETAIYLVKGRVETRYGTDLSQTCLHLAGEFLYIPPGVPHQPRNLSDEEDAIAIVARNDANERENVRLYPVDDSE